MSRKVVSKNDLLNLMNIALHENEELKDCSFTSVQKLQEADSNGCNWSVGYGLRCSGVPPEVCAEPARQVVETHMSKYNLE